MSSDVKKFARATFERLQLAIAFSIIRSAPPGKSATEYARELQLVVRREWHERDFLKPASDWIRQIESAALARHQEEVIEQLAALAMSDRSSHSLTGRSIVEKFTRMETDQDDLEIECCSKLFPTDSLYLPEDVETVFKSNLDFIRGIVRLQTVVGQDNPVIIPGRTLTRLVSEIAGAAPIPQKALTLRHLQDSEDSGIGSCDSNQETMMVSCSITNEYGVAKGVVHYALQSSGAENVVRMSVKEIVKHLCGVALRGTELPADIVHWEGSVLQQSVSVLRQLSNDTNYQKVVLQACTGLARILFGNMLGDSSSEMSTKYEHQVILLLQLCGNATLCNEVIQLLIEKINAMSEKEDRFRKKGDHGSRLARRKQIGKLENYFFIFYTIENLLRRYYKLREAHPSTAREKAKEKSQQITELWRCTWENGDATRENKAPNRDKVSVVSAPQTWRASLESAAVTLSRCQPLMAFYAYRCREIIVSCEKNACLVVQDIDKKGNN